MEVSPENVRWKMEKTPSEHHDSTADLIETLHASRKLKSILVNPDYLDDEKLPDSQRSAVLKEIFNKNIREKQLNRIISHLSPVLDRVHPESALVYGPTGSGKSVSLIHVLSSFSEVSSRHGIKFSYRYIDLTSPKTYFGALNEVAMALDSSNRKYRKGIPIEYMQGKIKNSISKYQGFLCLLIDEADNIRPNPDAFLTYLAKPSHAQYCVA
jgi:cell division control protein 6